MPSRLDCSVMTSANSATRSRQRSANAASPYLDLDPEPLAVEAVLVALLEAAQRLVALEDVLQCAAPGMVNAHRVVRRDRAVDEAEALVPAVLLAQPVEGPLRFPPREHLPLEGGMVRNSR
jgi:hypothetical protein